MRTAGNRTPDRLCRGACIMAIGLCWEAQTCAPDRMRNRIIEAAEDLAKHSRSGRLGAG